MLKNSPLSLFKSYADLILNCPPIISLGYNILCWRPIRTEPKRKQKRNFFVCRSSFDLFRFRLHFRSMWTDLKYCMLLGTSWYVSKQSTIMPIHKRNTKGFEKAFISEDGDRYQLITVIIVQQHTKQMKYNPLDLKVCSHVRFAFVSTSMFVSVWWTRKRRECVWSYSLLDRKLCE